MFNGAALVWRSKKQPAVTLSTCEAELVALSFAMQEALWLRRLLAELEFDTADDPTPMLEDNQGAIALVKDHKFSDRTKHVDIKYFFAREQMATGSFTLEYCTTADMLADAFTKALGRVAFQRLRYLLGVREILPS